MAPRRKLTARRRAVAGLVVTVMLVAVLLFAVFPTRTWLAQRREAAAAQAELDATREARIKAERAQDRLNDDEYIERVAKDQFGYTYEGEELYPILPAATDPIGLPEGWPFTGVERVFGAR